MSLPIWLSSLQSYGSQILFRLTRVAHRQQTAPTILPVKARSTTGDELVSSRICSGS